MYGDVVTNGQFCGINGCQKVTVEHRAGGSLDCSVELKNNEDVSVDCSLQNGDVKDSVELKNQNVVVSTELKNDSAIQVGLSLVCRTSVGAWEYLLVEEGKLLLIDGQAVMVKKQGYST